MTRSVQAACTVWGGRSVDTAAYGRLLGVAAPRGMKTTRLADADEDALTLAVAALRRLMAAPGANRPGELFLVGAFDEQATAVVAEAMDWPDVAMNRFAPSVEAAADALLVALGRSDDAATVLVAVTDGRDAPTRPHAGAGAVALRIAPGPGVRLLQEAHVRRQGAEPDHAANLLHAALTQVEAAGDGADWPVAVAERAPFEAATLLRAQHAARARPVPTADLGDLGPAAPLLAWLEAARAVGTDRTFVWAVPLGHGAIAARFRVEDDTGLAGALDGRPPSAAEPLQAVRLHEAWRGAETNVAQGAFVSPQLYLSQAPARYRLLGQRCEACQAVVFPPRECCPVCGADPLAPHPLSGQGVVHARTRIARGGAPTEFAPLQDAVGTYDVAIVELVEGPRVAAMIAGGAGGVPPIGARVEMVLRLLYVQDGMRRYGFKARPLAG